VKGKKKAASVAGTQEQILRKSSKVLPLEEGAHYALGQFPIQEDVYFSHGILPVPSSHVFWELSWEELLTLGISHVGNLLLFEILISESESIGDGVSLIGLGESTCEEGFGWGAAV